MNCICSSKVQIRSIMKLTSEVELHFNSLGTISTGKNLFIWFENDLSSINALKDKQIVSLVQKSIHVRVLESSSEVQSSGAVDWEDLKVSQLFTFLKSVVNVNLEDRVKLSDHSGHVDILSELKDTL